MNFTSKKIILLTHILSWGILIFTPYIFFDIPKEAKDIIPKLIFILLAIFVFYFNTYILIPKLLFTRKILIYLLTVIISLSASFYIFSSINTYYHKIEVCKYKENMMKHKNSKSQINNIHKNRTLNKRFRNMRMIYHHGKDIGFVLLIFIVLAISTGIKLTQEWYQNEKQKREMENEQLSSELSFLKSQINPHFLFNTLNGIYSLAYRKSDKAPDSILKLSDLMRYMLYESEQQKVELDREIEYLKNYISLQKLRLPENNKINIEMKTDANLHIEPMLLIPFVENAFKHGNIASGGSIDIFLSTEKQKLIFIVKNTTDSKQIQNKDKSSGIGLSNIKKRLSLLYPKNHTLIVENRNDIFNIEMTISVIS